MRRKLLLALVAFILLLPAAAEAPRRAASAWSSRAGLISPGSGGDGEEAGSLAAGSADGGAAHGPGPAGASKLGGGPIDVASKSEPASDPGSDDKSLPQGGTKSQADGPSSSPPDSPGQAGSDPSDDSPSQADVYASPFGTEPLPEPVMSRDGYLENGWLIWEQLMPADWDPVAIFEELNINDMADDDPRIDEIIEEFVKKWNASPVNREVDQKPLRIPGFVVPLDFEADEVAEFFLVPFFGACIHVPPPPPNQIILVRLKSPMGLGAMEVVEVYGKISVEGYTNDLGSAGYTLAADKVEFYRIEEDDG